MSAISEGFAAVARVSDLAPGEMKFVAVDRERVVLANVDGGFYALRDVCGHRNAPLSRGRLEGCLIECPLHFAQFDIRTGACGRRTGFNPGSSLPGADRRRYDLS